MGGMILPILSFAGTALGAVGQYQARNAQAASQAATARAQADAEAANARLAQINSEIAGNQGREARADAYAEGYKAMGRQRAALAQSGLISSPTGLLLQQEMENAVELDQNRLGRDADLNALGYQIQKSNALTASGVHRLNEANSKGGGKLGLIGGLMGGAAAAYGAYRSYAGGPK